MRGPMRWGPGQMGGLPGGAGWLLALLAFALGGCATTPRLPNVIVSPNHTLLSVGYSANRSRAHQRAWNDAIRYCWDYAEKKHARVIKETTTYHGLYPEGMTEAGGVAKQIGGVLGRDEVSQAGGLLSSGSASTDYKTTIEMQCE